MGFITRGQPVQSGDMVKNKLRVYFVCHEDADSKDSTILANVEIFITPKFFTAMLLSGEMVIISPDFYPFHRWPWQKLMGGRVKALQSATLLVMY